MRMRGHAEHDDMRYVPKELVDEWSRKDPIVRYERFLLGRGMTQADLDAVTSAIDRTLDDEVATAEESPFPDASDGLDGVYVGAAIGAALMGMRPIAEMQFIDFISCAFDILVNYAAKSRYRWGQGVGIVVRGPAGGKVHGGPFHSQNPEGYFLNVPGLKIVAP